MTKLAGWQVKLRPPRIRCDREIWSKGVRELNKRTRSRSRESGAFLLGRIEDGTKEILEFIFYDDLDPDSLSEGYVHFSGLCFPKLWDICRERGYGVVADVHVHPGGFSQSASDRENPVIPRRGHTAFIIPYFAERDANPGAIGIYEYRGDGKWTDKTGMGARYFELY